MKTTMFRDTDERHPGYLVYERLPLLPAHVLADLDAEVLRVGGLVDIDRGLWFIPAAPPRRRAPARRLREHG